MFDFGFSEMVVIAVIGLVVLGPERLPKVAKQAGQWLGKLQRYVSDVKSDINRQMELDELRKLRGEVENAASSLESSVRSSVSDVQSEIDSIASPDTGGSSAGGTPTTDWDRIFQARRARERISERRSERARELGRKLPKRRR
ncbi:MAG TPA: Sec-independent protein translocase protein TatB [Burkholderiaceae bacterium]